MDNVWLLKCLLMQKINIMSTLFRVEEMEVSKHWSEVFAALFLYFSSKNDVDQLFYAFLTCEIHLVKSLRSNLWIANDIISLKDFVINVKRRSVFIESCEIAVPINIRQKGQFLTKKLLASQKTVVPSHSETIVSLILLFFPNNQDFPFYPAIPVKLTLFTYIVDDQTLKMLVKNVFNHMLHILHRHSLAHLINIAYNNCFFANIYSVFDIVTFLSLLQHLSNCNISPLFLLTDIFWRRY